MLRKPKTFPKKNVRLKSKSFLYQVSVGVPTIVRKPRAPHLILGGGVDARLIGSESLSFGGGKNREISLITKSSFLQINITA
ncbi:hypothetical protein DLM78_08705 [Leptospira stimsonii]|uniref:Uncharacterized protein n=1 Tax=Leptospira stimsonii TaxID=2202203 RepID=A0A8B3CR58_9LEPT|nr:hypothetical protein DLM78_08705 [Leptospira stimsonii]